MVDENKFYLNDVKKLVFLKFNVGCPNLTVSYPTQINQHMKLVFQNYKSLEEQEQSLKIIQADIFICSFNNTCNSTAFFLLRPVAVLLLHFN